MQIGDLCLGFSFLIVLFSCELNLSVHKIDKPLLAFVVAVACINTIYAFVYQNADFVKPIFYFIFNFMCVYVTRIFWEDSSFRSKWNTVLKFNLLLQLVIYLLDMGRWYSRTRYMGTYNDPNQLAFGLLSTYCLIYCLNRKQHTKHQWIYFLITLFLIFETSSVGMFFGVSLIFVFEQYFRLAKIESNNKRIFYTAYLVILTVALIYAGSYFLLIVNGVVKTDINLFQRVANKFSDGNIFSASAFEDFIEDRGLQAFFEAPYRMLYGSGEGYFNRFNITNHELHSTWISTLYYYGIIPFCFLLVWIKNNLKKIDWYILPVYICIFAEAFTLINHRQPSFWALIVLGSFLKRKTDGEDLL